MRDGYDPSGNAASSSRGPLYTFAVLATVGHGIRFRICDFGLRASVPTWNVQEVESTYDDLKSIKY
jgi:hypothetical protein